MNEQQLKELLQKHCKLIETTYKVMGSFNAQIVVHGQKSRLVTLNNSSKQNQWNSIASAAINAYHERWHPDAIALGSECWTKSFQGVAPDGIEKAMGGRTAMDFPDAQEALTVVVSTPEFQISATALILKGEAIELTPWEDNDIIKTSDFPLEKQGMVGHFWDVYQKLIAQYGEPSGKGFGG